jgi:hypothetical protein
MSVFKTQIFANSILLIYDECNHDFHQVRCKIDLIFNNRLTMEDNRKIKVLIRFDGRESAF